MAGVLDSARFKHYIEEKLDFDYTNIEAMVIGAHSNTMVRTYEDWVELYKKLLFWELELENIEDQSMVEILESQKIEANVQFGKVHQEPATGALAIVNKGGSAVKNNIYTTLELNMYSPEDMLFMYQEKAKELQHYIDTNTMPEEVCDTAKFGMEKGVPKRCMLYCDFRDVCPNYSKYKKLTDRKIAEGLNSNIEKEKSVYIKPMEF
jgi:hypothetical protein